MNKLSFIEQICPICKKDTYEEPVDIVSDIWYAKGGWFPVVRCRLCQIQYTKLIPHQNSILYYYPTNYTHYIVAHSSSTRIPNTFMRRYLQSRLLPIDPPATLFEIGASNGEFLRDLIQKGYDAYGLEPSANNIIYTEELSGRIEWRSFNSEYKFSRSYDIIAAWMVLEHLYDPVLCCMAIKAGLTTNGVFIGSVPTIRCLGRIFFRRHWYGYQVPTHFTHFDSYSLTKVLVQAGFKHTLITYQGNCINLLKSFHYFLNSKNMLLSAQFVHELTVSKRFGWFRALLSAALKFTKLSGRLEFRATS